MPVSSDVRQLMPLGLLLADAVLVVHICIAAFVVGGMVFVVVGNLKHWSGANNIWFRVAHVVAIGIVVSESWLGYVCPLTTLEMWLRSRAGAASYGGDFIEHWLQQLLFYSAPPWVFVAVYTLLALFALATWLYFPPRFKHRFREPVA
jgi:polyferredoxin